MPHIRRGILIGIIGNDAARFHEFTASTLRLRRPEGSHLEFLIGGDWCGARNELAQQCLDGGFSHLWFMDDDHSFAPDLLLQLAAWDRPLVTPICLSRVFPFAPVSYVEAPPELAHHGDIVPIDLAGLPGGGLVELVSGGAAGMLIRRDVLEATDARGVRERSAPIAEAGNWFEYGDVSEDILFCEKATQAGFTLYADLGARLGHITTAVVIPSHTEEHGWTTGLRVGKDYDLRVKQTYDIIEDGRRRTVAPLEPDAASVGDSPALSDSRVGALSPDSVTEAAERIEIWQTEEDGRIYWWWRAIDSEGAILTKDSGVREEVVIAAANAAYPGVGVHLIQREIDDSRSPKQYGPPTRLWNREVQ
jgi:hypothetical protein